MDPLPASPDDPFRPLDPPPPPPHPRVRFLGPDRYRLRALHQAAWAVGSASPPPHPAPHLVRVRQPQGSPTYPNLAQLVPPRRALSPSAEPLVSPGPVAPGPSIAERVLRRGAHAFDFFGEAEDGERQGGEAGPLTSEQAPRTPRTPTRDEYHSDDQGLTYHQEDVSSPIGEGLPLRGPCPPHHGRSFSYPDRRGNMSPYFSESSIAGPSSAGSSSGDFSPPSRRHDWVLRDVYEAASWATEVGSCSDDEDDDTSGMITPTPISAGSGSRSSSTSKGKAPDLRQYLTVCAISESRDGEVIGLAQVYVAAQRVDITRIINDDNYERLMDTLASLPDAPECFLLLKIVVDGNKSLLPGTIQRDYPNTIIIPYERKHWNELEGLEMVDKYALSHEAKAVKARLDNNFYVSCALSAAMNFVQDDLRKSFPKNSLRINYIEPAGAMGLDRTTVESLELLQNMRKTTSKTLFSLLDSTLTPQGKRLLRSTLLQPSTDVNVIKDRHDAIEELTGNEVVFVELVKRLKALQRVDAEKLAVWLSNPSTQSRQALQRDVVVSSGRHQLLLPSHEDLYASEAEMNKILMLKQYLAGIHEIHGVLESAECQSNICGRVRQNCSPEMLDVMRAILDENIEQDAVFSRAPIDIRNNRIWAVKAKPRGLLEQGRNAFRGRTSELNTYVDSLNEIFTENLGNPAEMYLDNSQKYWLKFHWSDVEREIARSQKVAHDSIAGVDIINGNRKGRHYHCQTIELIQRSAEIQLQADSCTAQSDKVVVELKETLNEHAEQLLQVSEAISLLDMICSFVQVSTTQDYIRPTMGLKTLVVRGARHPVMEVSRFNFVANDIYSGAKGCWLQVVTGGNMSGKSTFIKSIALIQILAQMGCFVPAAFASMPICDRLFTRLSTDDKPESNLGTWAVELRDMNMIFRFATRDSLIIIDELGRGTSPKAGLAYALAMSEMLIRAGPRVFFATHFTKLGMLLCNADKSYLMMCLIEKFPARLLNQTRPSSVTNVHLTGHSTKTGDRYHVSLPHTLGNGPVPNEDYGLDLARRYFPQRLMDNAEKVTHFLRASDPNKKLGRMTREFKLAKLQLGLSEVLTQAHNSSMDDGTLASFLKKLQTDYSNRVAEVERDAQEEEETADISASAQSIPKPVLEKPGPEELQDLAKRGEREERRVMSKNRDHRAKRARHRKVGKNKRKRQVSERYSSPASKKTRSFNEWLGDVSNEPVSINRGRLVQQQQVSSLSQSPRPAQRESLFVSSNKKSPQHASSASVGPSLSWPGLSSPSTNIGIPNLNASVPSVQSSSKVNTRGLGLVPDTSSTMTQLEQPSNNEQSHEAAEDGHNEEEEYLEGSFQQSPLSDWYTELEEEDWEEVTEEGWTE